MRKTPRRAEYDAYINSATWREKRKLALAAAGFKCQRCGHATTKRGSWLHVHHLTYERFGGEEKPFDLMVLCKRCHEKEHEKPKKKKQKTKKKRQRKPRGRVAWSGLRYQVYIRRNGYVIFDKKLQRLMVDVVYPLFSVARDMAQGADDWNARTNGVCR